jgi:death-on-curing protein
MGREIYDIVNDMAEVLNASQMQRLQEVQVFGGEELYPTIQAKGTRLGYGLIKNHCMLDGNKRIGTHVMLVFFALNGIELRYTQKELYEMVLAVADGSLEYEDMLKWILEHQA